MTPDGHIAYITEGQLRAIHRKISPPPPGQSAPYHSFREADALPLEPGRPAEITFALLPVSVRVARGHRLRLALAGADLCTFPCIPATGDPVWTIYRTGALPSFIELPIKQA